MIGRGVCARLACLTIAVWNPGAQALAGCAAVAPTLLSGPRQMAANGTLSLALSHPLWHSRRAATGPADRRAPLGSAADDLPFVLLRNGSAQPLQIQSRRDMPRGQVVVELVPAAGWSAGATYEFQADVGTKQVYPAFAAVAGPDLLPPTWGTQPPSAVIIRPPAVVPEPPAQPPHKSCVTTGSGKTLKKVCTTVTTAPGIRTEEVCVTTGSGKGRTTECTGSGSFSGGGSSCPPRVEEAHVALRLPEVQDDHGGVIMLEIKAGDVTTWVPAAGQLDLGVASSCTPPNFPPPPAAPYELLVTPIDAAHNRGVTLHVPVGS